MYRKRKYKGMSVQQTIKKKKRLQLNFVDAPPVNSIKDLIEKVFNFADWK